MSQHLARFNSTVSVSIEKSHPIEDDEHCEENVDNKNSCCHELSRKIFPTGYWEELKGTWSLAWALILVSTSEILFQPVATMFGGHLGKLELDAIALSNTLINVLGNSIVMGFATCLETVLSQSFGMGNYNMLSIFFQRGFILHILLLMPCLAIHLNIKPLLLALGQSPDVVELTAQYLLYFMPGMLFLFLWTALRKFTECQNVVAPHIIIVFIGHGIHALLQYLLLYQFNFGIIGSSIAQSITFFAIFVMTLVYTLCSKVYKESWQGWSKQCLLDWGSLASLGLFGILMMCLEWWAFEVSIIIAGAIGDTELGAQSVTFNLESFSYGIPIGISQASCIRVGQFLGAAKRTAALNSARVGMTITIVNAAFWSVLFQAGASELPKIFTGDVEIIDLVSQLMPFVAIYTFFDAISALGRAVFRGIGCQRWGTAIIFVGYYVVALPIAIPLTILTPFGIKGLWLGFAIALFVSALIFFIAMNFCLNWEKLEKEALDRVSGNNSKSKEKRIDENAPLLGGSLSVSGLVTDVRYFPKSIYIRRVTIVVAFVLVPIIGLIVRLLTQNDYSNQHIPSELFNSTVVPYTNITSMYTELST